MNYTSFLIHSYLLFTLSSCTVSESNSTQTFTLKAGRWNCNQCPKTYSTKGNFTSHYKSKHTPNPTPNPTRFLCARCNKRFVKKSGVKEHIKRVHRKIPYDRTFKCTCGETFTRKFNLSRHESICAAQKNSNRATASLVQPKSNTKTTLFVMAKSASSNSHQKTEDLWLPIPREDFLPSSDQRNDNFLI